MIIKSIELTNEPSFFDLDNIRQFPFYQRTPVTSVTVHAYASSAYGEVERFIADLRRIMDNDQSSSLEFSLTIKTIRPEQFRETIFSRMPDKY